MGNMATNKVARTVLRYNTVGKPKKLSEYLFVIKKRKMAWNIDPMTNPKLIRIPTFEFRVASEIVSFL
jgi:hypothetical protein